MYYGTKIMVKQVRRGKAKAIDFRGRIESINCRGLVILIGHPGQLVYAPLRPKQTNECICKLNVLFTPGSKKKNATHAHSPKEKTRKN